MNNERDTHFQGFAKLLIERLLDNTEGYFLLMRNVPKKHDMEEAIRVIAESAYDLAYHTLMESAGASWIDACPSWEWVARIPDLTEWPKP